MMSMIVEKADAVIIGGGAAGMMAAITAAKRGRQVVLLEHEKSFGRKLRITGKGRCNLCNDCDVETVLQNVPRNPKFLYGSLTRFPPQKVMAFFTELGVSVKTERGRRVFPVSDKAGDVADALEREARRSGVTLIQTEAYGIRTEADSVTGVETANGRIFGRHILIATGGQSYPLTGSTGDGYRMAEALGHTIQTIRPALVPLESDDPDCREMQGFSLRNVRLTLRNASGKAVYSELGEMMFTHFGLTGPLILTASSHMADSPAEKYRVELDLKPGLDAQKLDARILRDFEKYKNRDFRNALDDLAGRAMIPVLVRRSGIPPDTRVHSITRAQREGLVRLFKNFSLSIRGTRGMEEAAVTAGGVSVKEIDPRTMESRLVPGLYFAGEVMDVDAYTGGFNLQIAWSTGYTAGLHL